MSEFPPVGKSDGESRVELRSSNVVMLSVVTSVSDVG